MERDDCASAHPDVVADLTRRMEGYARGAAPPFEPWPPFQGADYECCDCPETFARGSPPVWVPWVPDARGDRREACAAPFAPCLVPPCYGH